MTTRNQTTANRLLWTAQIVTALLFLFAGSMKFIMPADKMQGPIALPIAFIHFIGICEITGALGLILPGLFRIQTRLTPLAALGLLVIMIGATVLTAVGMGIAPALFPAAVGAIVSYISYGRSRAVPLRERTSYRAEGTRLARAA
jgi:uncharacterized membrane protein YphA (DoxX/SURF4 family)